MARNPICNGVQKCCDNVANLRGAEHGFLGDVHSK